MVTHAQQPNNGNRDESPTSQFTAWELARLRNVRKQYAGRRHPLDASMEEKRLEFALWLKEHGKLNEGETLS